MDFIETMHCRIRMHCRTCRDLEGGRAWRESLAVLYRLPGDVVDFECPHGIRAGDRVAPVAPTTAGRTGCGCGKLTEAELARMREIKAAGRPDSKS